MPAILIKEKDVLRFFPAHKTCIFSFKVIPNLFKKPKLNLIINTKIDNLVTYPLYEPIFLGALD